jgi:DNA-directed RNA polymerase specialized sigma24 family protein
MLSPQPTLADIDFAEDQWEGHNHLTRRWCLARSRILAPPSLDDLTKSLTQNQREVFLLRARGLEHKDIAVVLGMTGSSAERAVGKRIDLALDRLTKHHPDPEAAKKAVRAALKNARPKPGREPIDSMFGVAHSRARGQYRAQAPASG